MQGREGNSWSDAARDATSAAGRRRCSSPWRHCLAEHPEINSGWMERLGCVLWAEDLHPWCSPIHTPAPASGHLLRRSPAIATKCLTAGVNDARLNWTRLVKSGMKERREGEGRTGGARCGAGPDREKNSWLGVGGRSGNFAAARASQVGQALCCAGQLCGARAARLAAGAVYVRTRRRGAHGEARVALRAAPQHSSPLTCSCSCEKT